MLKIIVSILVMMVFIPLVTAVSIVSDSIMGNKVIFTYDGIPPFIISIKDNSDFKSEGGFMYAITDKKTISFDFSLLSNRQNLFYVSIKDATSTSIKQFTLCTNCHPEIYFKKPDLDSDIGMVTMLSNENQLGNIALAYDIIKDVIVSSENNRLIIITAQGEKFINTNLYEIARPSFSPDGQYVVVQAIEKQSVPEDLNIYIINLLDGTTHRISTLAYNEENPHWLSTNKILYNSFSELYGIKVHLYDVSRNKEEWSRDQESFNLASSPDGKQYMNTVQSTIHDIDSGEVLYDMKSAIHSALSSQLYTLDFRYGGQANMGACPLAGDFSPNGNEVVFDCAVLKNGQYGIILMTYSLLTGQATIVSELINHNPKFTNFNNFSPTYPKWK